MVVVKRVVTIGGVHACEDAALSPMCMCMCMCMLHACACCMHDPHANATPEPAARTSSKQRVEDHVEPQPAQPGHELPRGDGARREAQGLRDRHADGGRGLHHQKLPCRGLVVCDWLSV